MSARRTGVRWRRLTAALAAVLGLAGVLAVPAWGFWTDEVPVSGTTISAISAAQMAPTNLACVLTNPQTAGGFGNLSVSATVPTGSQFTYALQVINHSDNTTQIGPDHPVTPSGSTITYAFNNSEFPGIQTNVSIDFFARIVVRLANAPTWQAQSEINFDVQNATGGIGGVGGGFFYGSPIGQNSPGGVPGACTTA